MSAKQLGKRLLQILVVALGISFLTFMITYLAPGDPVRAMYSASGIVPSDEMIQEVREQMGLNRPMLVQYADWLVNCLKGDFGQSFSTSKPVATVLMNRLWPTLKLSISSMIIMLLVAVPIGMAQATHKNTIIDYALRGITFFGVSMHRVRTVAFLECLQEIYGVTFDKTSEELALVPERTDLTAGDLKVSICPGYLEIPQFHEAASQAILTGEYSSVLATIPVTTLMDALNQVEVSCGTTDCFSEDNYFGFKKNKISYVAGKYESEIGPAFAALYNAVTGHADVYRENGKAFRLQQGFWMAATSEEYDERYALASGAVINAYNYDDLYSVVLDMNPDATFEDYKNLVAAWTYEACLARRAQ